MNELQRFKLERIKKELAPMSNTIQQYEKEGYVGTDVTLEIALFEYGIIWKEDKEDGGYRFIYGSGSDRDGNYNKFGWGCIQSLSDLDWATFADVAKTCGTTEEEWLKLDLPQQVVDCFGYYGHENVFGTDYSGGFEVTDEEANNDTD